VSTDGLPPGPVGYQFFIWLEPISLKFQLSALLERLVSRRPFGKFCVQLSHPGVQRRPPVQLYRCFVIYNANYWAIAFPFLMYLATFGMCSVLRSRKRHSQLMSPIQRRASGPSTRTRDRSTPPPYHSQSHSIRFPLRSTSFSR
jgi:hypothetical protein